MKTFRKGLDENIGSLSELLATFCDVIEGTDAEHRCNADYFKRAFKHVISERLEFVDPEWEDRIPLDRGLLNLVPDGKGGLRFAKSLEEIFEIEANKEERK